MNLFFRHATAAKGLLLSSVTITALLVLAAPSSLTARATDHAGDLSELMSWAGLLMATVGWADVLYTDTTGRLILPRLQTHVRHLFCTMLYAALTGWYAIFAFAASDPTVHTSWLLVLYYIAVAAWGSVLTVSIAREPRHGGRE